MSDQRSEAADSTLPAEGQSRRNPFAHGALPMRPNFLPEEGVADRSEIWNVLLAVAIGAAAIVVVSWLVTLR